VLFAGGFGLFASFALFATQAQAGTPAQLPPVLTLEWCLERAKSANPSLEVARARATAAEHRVKPAGAFDDPRLSYNASNIPAGDFDFASTPLSGHQFGLRQKLPFPGERSNRRRAAAREATALSLSAEDERLAIEATVESAWAELGFARRALDITDRNIQLLRQLASTAEARYRVGNGLQQDVLRAQVELTARLEERLRREEAIEASAARLVALLDLPPTTALPPIEALGLTTAEPALEPLLINLDEKSPRLLAARAQVSSARHRVRATELEGLPDIDLDVGYRVRRDHPGDAVDGDDFISAGFTLRLPVDRGRWRARAAEQKANLRRAEAELRSARAHLASRVRTAHAQLVRAASEVELLRTGLVPQAQQSLESSRSAYKVGRIEFLSLLDSQVRLLNAELRLARATADTHHAFASLESAAGEKLR
jgi:outer membrane protein TolC